VEPQRTLFVVKLGGGQGINLEGAAQDLADYIAEEEADFVVVHGGSAESTLLGSQLNHPPQFLHIPDEYIGRYHDPKTLEIYVMATVGKVNKAIVQSLQAKGVNAVGLSGADGRLMEGHRYDKVQYFDNQGQLKDLPRDYTGKLDHANTELISLMIEHGYTPVITPLGLTKDNELVYIDADRAAAHLAAALCADTLVVLGTVPGLLRDPEDPTTLIRQIPIRQFDSFVEEFARGRMRRKMAATLEALQGDVRRIVVADGRVAHPIRAALNGVGTTIVDEGGGE